MSEQVLAQVPSIFRWKGPKQGRTMLTAQAGRLTLTSERLIFEPARGEPLVVPLGAVEGAELTGKRIKNLTVGYRGSNGTEYSTFATQQFGMPSGQSWVDQIQLASAAARGQVPLPPPSPVPPPSPTSPVAAAEPGAPHAITAEPMDPDEPMPRFPRVPLPGRTHAMANMAFEPFQRAHSPAPLLDSWQVLRILEQEVVDPATGTVEIWGDVASRGPIQYLFVAAGYTPTGVLRVLAGAETMPGFHDDCYLGVFLDGVHHNLGAHEECRTLEGFTQRGVDVVLGVLDGDRRARESGGVLGPGAAGPVPGPPAPPPAPPAPPAPAPPASPPPAETTPTSREEAMGILRMLDAQSREDPPRDHVGLATYLRVAGRTLEYLDEPGPAAHLMSAAQHPDDPVWMASAGDALLDAGVAQLATVPLRAALRLGSREPSTVEALAAAHEFSGDLRAAAQVLRDHVWALETSEAVRARWTHIAAMTGDLAAVRRTLTQLIPDGPYEAYRGRALDRLARADALGPLEGDPESEEALRWWDAVLHGAVLAHVSSFGVEDMHGRYAAVFDDSERLGQVLSGLDESLRAAGHGTPARVLAAPDRDSQILGWALCSRYGVAAPGDLADLADDGGSGGPTLVAAYTWTGVLDAATADRLRADPTAVVFAYSLDWTRPHRLVPDVVGLEAQTIIPPWGERMRVAGMPGADLPAGERPVVETIPADEREPSVVGAEQAALAAAAPVDEAGLRAVVRVVERLRDAGAPAGLLGGMREFWPQGGPLESSHF